MNNSQLALAKNHFYAWLYHHEKFLQNQKSRKKFHCESSKQAEEKDGWPQGLSRVAITLFALFFTSSKEQVLPLSKFRGKNY